MALRYRTMRAEDVPRCVEIIAQNPLVAPRYGDALADLERVWRSLLGRLAFTAVVFEELQGDGLRLFGVGVSAFVDDQFVRDLKTPPLLWIGPELLRRITRGESPLLSDKSVIEANTRGGLNLVGWDGATSLDDAERADILNFSFYAFVDLHRGFLVKELLGQADSAPHFQAMRNIGSSFYDPDLRAFVPWVSGTAEDGVTKPHLIGSTREMALAGTWLSGSALFAYEPPRMCFTSSQQRLLTAALQGGTDEELSQRLEISLSAVRRCWLSIYERIVERAPDLIGQTVELDDDRAYARGKGKKHRVLAYLREHPEELRPVSQKLLRAQA